MNSIKLFENLAQYNYNNQYFDFHNDYLCSNLFLKDDNLILEFFNKNNIFINLQFEDASIVFFNFFNVKNSVYLTIDNIYRGRFEENGKLLEITENGKFYFYLEFVEGQKMEFFAKNIKLKSRIY